MPLLDSLAIALCLIALVGGALGLIGLARGVRGGARILCSVLVAIAVLVVILGFVGLGPIL